MFLSAYIWAVPELSESQANFFFSVAISFLLSIALSLPVTLTVGSVLITTSVASLVVRRSMILFGVVAAA